MSRINLSTDDYDKRLLSVFIWQPLLGIAEIYLLYFLCESIVLIKPWNWIRTPIDKKLHVMW
jgi:hypothetical protein